MSRQPPRSKTFSIGIRAVFGVSGIAALGLLAFYSLKVAEADRLASSYTLDGLKRASRLVPNNAEYLTLLSNLEADSGTDPSGSLRTLERSLALNPRDTASWINLGSRAESAGDFEKAERSYLAAAKIDKQLWPRWNLAQFYFRRHDLSNFSRWAKATAEMARNEQDLYPLFVLCWKTSQDSETILTRDLPNTPSVNRSYLAFLVNTDRLAAAEAVAERLLAYGTKQDADFLLSYCDRLLSETSAHPQDSGTALKIWNSLADRRLLPYQPIKPDRAAFVTNGNFEFQPISRGFDWRINNLPGVLTDVDRSLVITFSGEQPEKCEIAYQFVPLVPRDSYRVAFSYRTVNATENSGLFCRVFELPSGKLLTAETPWLASDDWKEGTMSFSISGTSSLVRLVFGYERPLGMMRLEGSICLRNIRIEPHS